MCVLIAVIPAISGCGNDHGWPERYPTKVKVLYNGKPPVGATIVLHPADKIGNPSVVPSRGVVAEDGTVIFTTYMPDDGVPTGDYVLTAFWKDGSANASPNRLPAKYLNPVTSDFKVHVDKNINDLGTINLTK
jgi:hypothetical protein